jgi:hypothetical protein
VSVARTIVGVVLEQLGGINGPAGGYVLDLEGRAYVGDPGPAVLDGQLPAVWLAAWTIDARDDDQLGAYRRVMELQIIGAVQADGDDPGERMLLATDLLSDIARALESNRTMRVEGDAQVVSMLVRGQAVDGGQLGVPQCGVCEAAVTLEYIRPSAGGF